MRQRSLALSSSKNSTHVLFENPALNDETAPRKTLDIAIRTEAGSRWASPWPSGIRLACAHASIVPRRGWR
jgi:hypothetical protein